MKETLRYYRTALWLWAPLLSVHLFVRLLSAAAMVPLIALFLRFVVSFSDQSALTDQDIARFLLTPMGGAGMLVVASLLIMAAIMDIAAMTAVIRSHQSSPWKALQSAIAFLVPALPRLALFAGHLLVRILLLALPYLGAGAVAAAYLLGQYDINYYLAFRPPEFMIALGVGAVCGLLLVLQVIERLSAWAIAMHLVVFDLETPRRAFALSRTKMYGHRFDLIRRILLWLAVRLVLAFVLATVVGFLLAEGPPRISDNLKIFFMLTSVLLVVWVLANALLNAVANGALADIFNEEFDRSLEARPARGEAAGRVTSKNYGLLPLGLTGIALVALFVGGVAFSGVGGLQTVEVIGHRGAAASRPENTMAAVIKAVEDGADWVEIDVQESADGAVIVVHDSDFMKAAGVATKVWDVTVPELSEIDIGSWFDPAYAEERTPLLSDVLQAVKGRSGLIIELKYYGHDVDLEKRVIALVEEAGMADQIATMSLKYPAVQKMLGLRPNWRTGVLAATSLGNMSGLEGDFLAVSSASVSARLLAQAETAGKDVYAWTVNDAPGMSRMISLGVDGLITDEPALAREVIEAYAKLTAPQRLMLRLGDVIGFTFDLTPEQVDEI